MVAEHSKNATASYPPRSSLEAALSSQRTESMATVNLSQAQQPDASGQETCNQDEAEAMRVRGGCIPLDACGCVFLFQRPLAPLSAHLIDRLQVRRCPNVECCCTHSPPFCAVSGTASGR